MHPAQTHERIGWAALSGCLVAVVAVRLFPDSAAVPAFLAAGSGLLAGGLVALALGGWRRAVATPWDPERIRVRDEPDPSEAAPPWRRIAYDFARLPAGALPVVRDETGRWISAWRHRDTVPELRLRAHAFHARFATRPRVIWSTTLLIVLGMPLVALTGAESELGRLRLLLLLGFCFAFGPYYRTLVACRRIREVRSGDLRGVDVTLDDLKLELWLRRQGRRIGILVACGLGACFLAQLQDDGLAERWQLSRALVFGLGGEAAEPWRLLTAGLIHLDLFHFGFNLYALLLLSRLIEPVLGGTRTALILGGSLLVASGTSVLSQAHPSLGASGAILGLLGAAVALDLPPRRTFPTRMRNGLRIATGLIVVTGLLGVGIIDEAAHTGGLVGGALLARWLAPPDFRRVPARELTLFTLLCVVAFGLFTAPVATWFQQLGALF